MNRILRSATLLIAVLALPAALHADPVSIEPTSVEIPADPGARHRQVLTIANTGSDETLSLTLIMADWTIGKSGAVALTPGGQQETSAADWARVTPGFMALAPGQSGQVIVDFVIPAKPDRSGNYRTALLASQVAPGPHGIMQRTEASSLFYFTIDPAVSAPAITGVRLTGPPDARQLEVDLSNSGNAHARLEGKIRIEGDGHPPIVLPVANLVVLEASQRTFVLPIDGELPERARVTVEFDNLFAPQVVGGMAPVRSWSAPLDTPAG